MNRHGDFPVPEERLAAERRDRLRASRSARWAGEAHADLQRVLSAVLAEVGGEVVVSPATLATAAFTGRIEVEPHPGGGMVVRYVSAPPEVPGNRRSHPDRVNPDDEGEVL